MIRSKLFAGVVAGLVVLLTSCSTAADSPTADTTMPPASLTATASDTDPTTVATPSATADPAGPTAHQLGLADTLTDYAPPDRDRRLAGMAALGATWVRTDLRWSDIQANGPTSYDWAQYDDAIKSSQAHGLKVLGIIDYTPQWARPANCGQAADPVMCAPTRPGPGSKLDGIKAYGAFAGQVAARYRGQVAAYEIWNECNIQAFFAPKANPAQYLAMLQEAYRHIKAVDPSARVLVCGTAPAGTDDANYSPTDFIQQLYQLGLAGHYDSLALHPYTFPRPATTENWSDIPATLELMQQYDPPAAQRADALWLTEFGFPTSGPGSEDVSEAQEALNLTAALQLYRAQGHLGPLFWYTYQDGPDPSTNESYFGLVRYNGTPKPAYTAFQRQAKLFR